jgi:hypothetical protein
MLFKPVNLWQFVIDIEADAWKGDAAITSMRNGRTTLELEVGRDQSYFEEQWRMS